MSFNNQAKLLRVTRFNAGLGQQQMAERLGFDSAQMVSNIERGVMGIPSKYWKKLIELCGIGPLKEALIGDLKEHMRGVLK